MTIKELLELTQDMNKEAIIITLQNLKQKKRYICYSSGGEWEDKWRTNHKIVDTEIEAKKWVEEQNKLLDIRLNTKKRDHPSYKDEVEELKTLKAKDLLTKNEKYRLDYLEEDLEDGWDTPYYSYEEVDYD